MGRTMQWFVYLSTATAVVVAASSAWSADAAAKRPNTTKVDISVPGVYRSGSWEYRLIVTAPGSKSEGTKGILLFDGRPVEEPAIEDYYRTPWGEVQWIGNPVLLWGAHGWMVRPKEARGGRALAEPWIESGGPVVMTMVLCEAKEMSKAEQIEPWVKTQMQQLGVKSFRVERQWFPLGGQAIVIHDTKMLGTLTARLAPARDANRLTVIFDGTTAGRLELPRTAGAVKLVLRRLGGEIASEKFYLAFRVDRPAAAWPCPLDIGPESDGKEVVVKGVKEVVIGLPGDKRSGCAWMIKNIQGDAPVSCSVQSVGETQFTPATGAAAGAARNGTFENVLRVIGVGKSYVELEYKRAWQTDRPPEKMYKVTLDVKP